MPDQSSSFVALVGPEALAQLERAFSELCALSVVFTDLDHLPLLTGHEAIAFRFSVPIEVEGQLIARLAFGEGEAPQRLQPTTDILRTLANLIAQQAATAYQNKLLSRQMAHLSIGVTQAHEEERHRIARELHDETTQGLSSIALGLQLLMFDLVPESNLYTSLEQLHVQAVELTKQVRLISQDLRPPALDNFGLVPSLRQLIKRFEQQKHAPQVTLVVEGEVYRQPPDRELALFRVVQETLNNAYKHAQAKTILITLEFAQDFIKVNVLDDGLGFTVSADFSQLAIEGHLGLVGMQERMAAVGGQWWIRSEPEQGCQVSALCPRLGEGQTTP